MAANFCVQCGAPRTDDPVCQLCGAGYVTPIARSQVARSASASVMTQNTHNVHGDSSSSNAYHHQQQLPSRSYIRADQDSTSSTESYDFTHSLPSNNGHVNGHVTNNSNTLRRAQSVPISGSTGGISGSAATPSRGLLARRYADHPNCDICRSSFDVIKRRHQCRHCGFFVCGACSPVRLLIPWGEQIDGAKGYDQATPQRVCLHCAPTLHPLQHDLVALHARANAPNDHEASSRMHLPYTDSLATECQHAADIIGNFFRDDNAAAADRSIPVAFLQQAQGLAVLTIVKAGFMVAGKLGTGLVVSRLSDGSWSAPSAIGTAGLSTGFQIGGELVDVLLILGSRGAVEVFHKPQVNLGAGLDIAVGPYGRSAAAAAAVSTRTLNANYSYSHSKGLFAGVALTGSVIAARTDLNRKFYGRDVAPKDLLDGAVAPPVAAKPLYDAIDNAMRHVADHHDVLAERAAIMGACRICACATFAAHTMQLWNKRCKRCDHIH